MIPSVSSKKASDGPYWTWAMPTKTDSEKASCCRIEATTGGFQTVKKVRRPQKQYNAKKETVNFRCFLFELLKHGWPLGANAFAFCVVRLLPYPYTPTEAHSLPLRPFRQPPSVSKTMFLTRSNGTGVVPVPFLLSLYGF